MVTYYVKKNEVYKVSATENCEIYDANGDVFASCDAGQTLSFTAPTSKISFSDESVAFERVVDENSELHASVIEHLGDSNSHVTATDKGNWNETVEKVNTDFGVMSQHIDDGSIHLTEKDRQDIENSLLHINDSTLHERVLNITELFPASGSGDSYDQYTLTQALTFANQYITVRGLTAKVIGGLKVKYKNFDGEFVSYTWDGVGSLTDASSWHNAEIDHMGNNAIHMVEGEREKWNNAATRNGFAGEIRYYAGTNVPSGYLLCDGSEVNREEYSDLFEAIGTTWGEGDGVNTFALPNLIDRVIWGATTAGGYLDAALPNINGSFSITDGYSTPAHLIVGTASGSFSREIIDGASNLGTFDYSAQSSGKYTKATFDASKSSSVYKNDVNTVQPPAAKLIPIIRY